ncbi:MAG: 50S ribosomal protein L11 methyltransferase, partial [Desulfobacterales bacterium]|nr:50S ribosomal protein L11 methyltransferase [Desulfobacterales bacterium]
VVVLSGLKEEEIAGLEELYENRSFVRKWRDVEQGWASMVLVKRMGRAA